MKDENASFKNRISESFVSVPRGGHQVNSLISISAGRAECSAHTCQQINVSCLWRCLMAFSGVKAGKKGTDFLLLGEIETPGRQSLFRQILAFSDYRAPAPANSVSALSGKMGGRGHPTGVQAVGGSDRLAFGICQLRDLHF